MTNILPMNPIKRFTQTNPIVQIAEYHGFKPVQSKSQVNLQSGIYPSTWNTGNCWVDISSIHIEKTCQREIGDLRKKKISAIASNFDAKRFKRPILVLDPDSGKYVCVDGQGRIIAAHMNGNSQVPCEIHTPSGEDFEDYCREIFVSQHDNEDSVKGWDRHKVTITMDESYISTAGKGIKSLYNNAKDLQRVLDYDPANYTFATSIPLALMSSNKTLVISHAYEYVSRLFKKNYQLESSGKSEPRSGNRSPRFAGEILKAFADDFGDVTLVGQNLEAAAEYVRRMYVKEMKVTDPDNLPSWQGGSPDNKDCRINTKVLTDQIGKLRHILRTLKLRGINTQEDLKKELKTANLANDKVRKVGADELENIYDGIISGINLAS